MEQKELNSKFYELFKQKDKFIRFAYFYVLDKQVAEDLVMDSFLYYWENRDNVDIKGNLIAYILKILKHKSLDYLKLQKIHNAAHEKMREEALWDLDKNIASLEQFESYDVITDECRRMVMDAVKHLPEKTRRIFLLSRVRNMKYNEIAEEMGLSEKSVEYHITKALKVLREKLKGEYVLTFFMF